MNKKIEFYNCPDGSINYQTETGAVCKFDESCKDIIQDILLVIRDIYPSAFRALSEIYSTSERNKSYFEYRIVHRFIRCNFGAYDDQSYDIDTAGNFNFEKVQCPMRGECPFEGRICLPNKQSRLSERETEVAKLLMSGLCKEEIADELGMSPYTVIRHISNIRHRLGLKSTVQLATHLSNVKL